ncbi:phosphoribosylanthranilate isomerase [Planctomycetales bacterium ZRK34]|nr:phosphoribosylanthranilate isomerase [Planctomycetales bacterium ZRK34]
MPHAVQIKICGLRDIDCAQAAAAAGADMIGFVFVEASPRHVTLDQARSIAQAMGGRVECVGVFKDAPVEYVREHAEGVPLDRVQLHGQAPDAWIEALGPTPVVRAVSFDPSKIEPMLEHYAAMYQRVEHFAGLLIDTPDPSPLGGGTGVTFDWPALRRVLARAATNLPIMLAGGLTPGNVAEAIEVVRPWGVDVSSGVESSRGVKDIKKIAAFCKAAR